LALGLMAQQGFFEYAITREMKVLRSLL